MDYNPEPNEENEEIWFSGRDGHVLLIDCSKVMFEEKKIHEAFEIIEAMIRNLIIKNEKNLLGIIFYNTEKSPPPIGEDDSSSETKDLNNVAVFLNIKTVCADSMKLIRRYKENDINDFPVTYGHCDTNPNCLNDALWIASKMLRCCGYKLRQSCILLLTENPEPFEIDTFEARNAFKRAEDLRDCGITVTVVPMSDGFTGAPFYTQFLMAVNDCEEDDIEEDLFNPSQQREQLLLRVFKKDYTKCCNSRVKFQIGEGLEISVGIYPMYREAKPPKAVILNRKDNEIVQSKRVAVIATEAESESRPTDGPTINLMPSETKKYQELGGENITFSMEEYTQMKRIMNPGIILLGFKPKSAFKPVAHLRGPNFMYPDESIIKGSTTLFRALWEGCLKNDKVAYAIIVERVGANPKLVALVPQEEQTGKYYRYNGFRIEYLPYADSIRDIEHKKDETVDPDEISESAALFKKIAKKLRFRYTPKWFINPVVRGLYNQIEATVLEETPPEPKDTTLPDDELQDKNLAGLIDAFNEMFPSGKRMDEGTEPKRPAKVPKTFDENELRQANDNGTLAKISNDVLKAFLTSKGVTGLSKLKKDGLIEKVQEILENEELASVPLP